MRTYWLPIEKSLRNKMDYSNLDDFFMQYIVFKTSKPVGSYQLYNSFVQLFKESNYSNESCLKELKYFAGIYSAFVYGSKAYSERINHLLGQLRILNQTTCYPFLLHVFDDYHNNVIDESVVEKILEFILAYLLRRLVCGVPSNTLKGLFTYLYNRVFKVVSNKQKYYEAVNKFLFTVSSKDVVPSVAEFERALQTTNIYGNPALCRFLLLDIENGDGKETLCAENLTIEHIMPQTLSADWNYITPEEHEEYLHTLGNLSVTGYNSELSNKSFKEKQEIIRENSKAVVLNSDVLDKESWQIDDIKKRAKRLTGIVMSRHKINRIVDDSIEFEYIETMNLNNYDDVTGKKLISFKLFDEAYRQNKYALMLVDVIKLLDKKIPGRLDELAEEVFSINTGKKKHPHLNIDGSGMRWSWKVRDGVYLEANLSAWHCIKFIDDLLKEFGFPKEVFSFNIIVEEPSDTSDED